jgi:tetratricopeptide (TPR) repeat protein
VALWQAKAAQRQAQLAQTRLNQAEGLLRFTSAVLTNQVRADETITLRELLQRAEASMERTMADRPVEHALAAELLAQWQGSLGDIKQSIRLVTAAIERLGTEGDPAVLERLRCRLGVSLSLAGESQAALSALDAALRSPSGDASSRLTCELHHATVLRNLNRAEEAMRWAQAAHKTLARLPNPPPWRRASVQGELGFALVISGKPSQAMAHFDEALRLHMSDPDAPTATTVFMFNNRAIALLAAGQPARAAQELENAIAFGRERTPDHQAPAIVLVNLGNALRTAGRLDDAENAYRRAQIRAREVNYPVAEAGAAMGLAALMLDRHNTAAARPHLESAQAIHANMNLAPESPGGGNLRIAQARWWLVAGERERADSALADLVSGFGIGKPSTAAGLLSLRAEVARGRGDLDAAIRLLQEALARAREAQGDFASSASAATVLVAQGEVESLRGRPEQAMALARQALNDALAAAGPEHPAVARAHKLIEAKGAPPGAP